MLNSFDVFFNFLAKVHEITLLFGLYYFSESIGRKEYHSRVRWIIWLSKKKKWRGKRVQIVLGNNIEFFIRRAKAILALLTKSAGFYPLCRGAKWFWSPAEKRESEDEKRTDSGTRCAGAAEVLEEALGF